MPACGAGNREKKNSMIRPDGMTGGFVCVDARELLEETGLCEGGDIHKVRFDTINATQNRYGR